MQVDADEYQEFLKWKEARDKENKQKMAAAMQRGLTEKVEEKKKEGEDSKQKEDNIKAALGKGIASTITQQ